MVSAVNVLHYHPVTLPLDNISSLCCQDLSCNQGMNELLRLRILHHKIIERPFDPMDIPDEINSDVDCFTVSVVNYRIGY